MWTTRNIVVLAAGAVALVSVAYLSGKREGGGSKVGQTDVSSARPLIPPQGGALDASPSPASPKLDPSSAPIANMGDLFERLDGERKSRPNLEPTADSVFAKMKKLGVEEDEHLQVAGWTIGAKFCDKVRTKKDVHVVVCEFPDEDSAIKGQKNGESAIKNREVLRNKTTTCAVHQTSDDKAASTEAAKIKDLFKSL